jgi:hypothetical protein
MGLFSSKPKVSEDYMPTRATAAIFSDPNDRKWFVQDLAAMDAVITEEVPDSEGVIAILLYTRGELLVLTPSRLLLFRQAFVSNRARLDKEVPLGEVRDVRMARPGMVRLTFVGPKQLREISFGDGNTNVEPARMFFDFLRAARERLSAASSGDDRTAPSDRVE